MKISRPQTKEYESYYQQYIDEVPDVDLITYLEEQEKVYYETFILLDDEKGRYRYEKGKWSLKELLGHITDVERVFSYRLLRFGRNDKTPLSGFDHDVYVKEANFNNQKMTDLIGQFTAVRRSFLYLLKSFSENDLNKIGTASGKTLSVRALAFVTAGHANHHLNIIKDRYLN